MTNMFPYHVVARTNNHEFFKSHLGACWNVFSNELYDASEKRGLKIHAFVLMSNHFHLIASTTDKDLGFVMNRLMTNTSNKLNAFAGTRNHIFGGRYKGCLITTGFYFANCLKYVYRNPVKAKLVERVEDYSYSSIVGVHLGFPVSPCSLAKNILPGDFQKLLNWFNQGFENQHDSSIGKGLVKTEFSVRYKRTSDSGYRIASSLC